MFDVRRFALVVLVALMPVLAIGWSGQSRSHEPTAHLTLWLDYTPWGVHVPIYVAQSKGFFKREGVDVDIKIPANVDDPLHLAAFNADTLAIGYMSDVVTAEAGGIPVESIAALVQHQLNCIMTLKSSGITSPKLLAGKSIGAAETPADTVILNTVFRKAGVLGKVRRVNVNFDYVPALLTHRADAIEGAYQVWERIEIQQQGYRVNVIQLRDWGVPDEYELVLLASHGTVTHDSAAVGRFMKALDLGERYAVRHPQKAVAIFLKDNSAGFDSASGRSLVRRSWHLLIPFVQPPGVEFGSQSARRWHSLAVWMLKNKLISHVVPNSRLFTNAFQPAVHR